MKPLDRRGRDRVPDGPCPSCRAKAPDVSVTIRSAYLIYYKCAKCGHVWQVEKPPPRGQRRRD